MKWKDLGQLFFLFFLRGKKIHNPEDLSTKIEVAFIARP